MKRYIAEFKAFAMKGSVLDLAIGVVIGAAFGKIVDSLVTDVVMPILGILLGGIDFTQISFGLKSAQINVGLFIQASLNFIIVAMALFVVIKLVNRVKKEKPTKNDPIQAPDDIILLTEIRDLLKK